MDFTLQTYTELLRALLESEYQFIPYKDYNPKSPHQKTVILRHDVDMRPYNSYRTALIENELGIRGTYYFRIVKESFDRDIIKKIAALGHEIGYHYEDLALAGGDIEEAFRLFKTHLKKFEGLYPVETICMHGSPLSKHDNRLVWRKYDYTQLGIISEPYFDIDFSKLLYLTDTGRRWDGEKMSVRDKEPLKNSKPLSSQYRFRSSYDIIDAALEKKLPDQIMLNFHPQRWSDDKLEWYKEYVWQGIKNQVKRIVVKSMAQYQG